MGHYARPNREKRSHGVPIQIYTEILDVGKSLSGTKKRIRWRFGWSESPEEQEIELIHSVVSGKKTVLEDGNEIVSQTSMLETKFNHAWHSHGLYVFRVEAHVSMMEESQYYFSIDGIRFMDWQKKDLPRRVNEPNRGRYTDARDEEYQEDDGSRANRGGSRSVAASRGGFNAQGARPGGAQNAGAVAKRHVQSAQQTRQQQQQPQQSQRRQQAPDATDDDSTFDPFAPSAAKTNAFDPFAQPANSQSQSQLQSKPRARTISSEAEPQLFDQFDAPAPPRPQQQQPRGTSASFDAFATSIPPASGFTDPFSSQPSSSSSPSFDAFSASSTASAALNGRQKAGSMDLISDFAGMSFSPPPVPVVPPPQTVDSAPAAPVAEVPADLWNDSKLVNLDLTGKAAAPAPVTPATQAPSLNHLMGNTAPTQRAPSPQTVPMANTPYADPFGAPALLPPSVAPRPVVPAVAPVMSKAAAISSMGGTPPPHNPFAAMQRGPPGGQPMGAMGGAPPVPQFLQQARPNPFASGGFVPPQGQTGGAMPTRGLSIPVANPYGAPTAPKSSLDTIQWK